MITCCSGRFLDCPGFNLKCSITSFPRIIDTEVCVQKPMLSLYSVLPLKPKNNTSSTLLYLQVILEYLTMITV